VELVKVAYHNRYAEVYSSDPASIPGRMESILNELRDDFQFVTPEAASEEDLRLVHGDGHIERVKRLGLTYQVSLLAAGGAIKAAKLAVEGDAAFGLIRPPGHHASRDSSWGFCYFNNVAISVERIRQTSKVTKVLIVDIDLHYGDGTDNIFRETSQVSYFHVIGGNRKAYLDNLSRRLEKVKECDIIAVSAGFDRHERDWGGLLETQDYQMIGEMLKKFAKKTCGGRRYAVLEGGYNLAVLGKNVRSLLEGMK
jgi:acetoin utilization deacetylase AcuC-like enzyme